MEEQGWPGPSLTGRWGGYVGGVGMQEGGAQPSGMSPQERQRECYCVEELLNRGRLPEIGRWRSQGTLGKSRGAYLGVPKSPTWLFHFRGHQVILWSSIQ